jgi:hypothetical protein
MASLKILTNRLEEMKQDMLSEGKFRKAFFARTMYPLYQKKQGERFATSGRSEQTDKWTMSKEWKEYKIRVKSEEYPGGDRPGIYTGKLFSGVVGVGNWKELHSKAFSDKRMVISTTRERFSELNKKFHVTEWGENTRKEFKRLMTAGFAEFLKSRRSRK